LILVAGGVNGTVAGPAAAGSDRFPELAVENLRQTTYRADEPRAFPLSWINTKER
jgi:hypothetical protein